MISLVIFGRCQESWSNIPLIHEMKNILNYLRLCVLVCMAATCVMLHATSLWRLSRCLNFRRRACSLLLLVAFQLTVWCKHDNLFLMNRIATWWQRKASSTRVSSKQMLRPVEKCNEDYSQKGKELARKGAKNVCRPQRMREQGCSTKSQSGRVLPRRVEFIAFLASLDRSGRLKEQSRVQRTRKVEDEDEGDCSGSFLLAIPLTSGVSICLFTDWLTLTESVSSELSVIPPSTFPGPDSFYIPSLLR